MNDAGVNPNEKVEQLAEDVKKLTDRVAALENAARLATEAAQKGVEQLATSVQELRAVLPKINVTEAPKVAATPNKTEALQARTITLIQLLVAIGLSILLILFGGAEDVLFDDLRAQLTFLGFVVALTAYLANVRRDGIKALQDKSVEERTQRKQELAFVTSGEQALVVLGIITTVRIGLAPIGARLPWFSTHPVSWSDHLLVTILFVIVWYLAWVHLMEWKKARGSS